MEIKFLDKNDINYSRVKELLLISKDNNLFTNNGPVKNILEDKLKNILGLDKDKKVLCLNNGTSALSVLLFLYEIKNKKSLKWLSPSFTFPSVISNKHNTLLTDIDINTFTLNENDSLINEVDGIILTNLFGTTVDIEKWVNICLERGKILIFDNASSPLTLFNGKKISNYGDASYGSLHHTKYMGFGEGGFIVINEKDYELCKTISNFGFYGENISNLSSNFKMSDISASFILQHLESFNYNDYIDVQNKLIKKISQINGVNIFNYNEGVVYGNLPLLFERNIESCEFIEKGISANKYYKPLLPHKNSLDIYNRIINLPLNNSLNDEKINFMVNKIKEIL